MESPSNLRQADQMWSAMLGESLSAADGYYVKSISSGSTDLLKEKLKVTASASPTITITLAATP